MALRRAGPTESADERRTARLLAWFRGHRRPLPWRVSPSPYHCWVAEVILQQTRVAQAVPLYERFVPRFPDVQALAAASLEDVLKTWEGAGYYARARNLHRAARTLIDEHEGSLPRTIEELEALPGVGPYIARAIASLAFGAPVVALEANGLRVAARWTLERDPLTRPAVRARLSAELERHLPGDAPGEFNEAIMELGETICTPAMPRCPACPVAESCRARQELPNPGALPAREKAKARPHVVAAAVALSWNGRWLVQQRPLEGLLGGLWEFPGGKLRSAESAEAAARRELKEETGLSAPSLRPRGVVRHAYTHFTVDLHLFEAELPRDSAPRVRDGALWLTPAEFEARPRPKATIRAVQRLSRPGGSSRG